MILYYIIKPKKRTKKHTGMNTKKREIYGLKLKRNLMLITFLVIGLQIVLSQTTDSLKISRKQANEVANGLLNEGKLKKAYKLLKTENNALQQAYESSSNRNTSYKDTIIPSLESLLLIKEDDIIQYKNYTETLEVSLRSQKRKKYLWLGGGVGVGIILSLILAK